MAALAGCGQAGSYRTDVEAADAARDAAIKRMIVVPGTSVGGHPNYVTLGPVQGRCEQSPPTRDKAIEGESLRQSAYRRYGAQVDAIVGLRWWFVTLESRRGAPYGARPLTRGYLECRGTAVSFVEQPAPAKH